MKISFEVDENNLPTGWGVARVKEIAEIVRGVTYKKADATETQEADSLPILRATNIQDSSLVLDRDMVFVPSEFVSESQKVRVGDIVVATSSGSKHLVGKTAQVRSEWKGSFGAFCAAIRPKNGIEPRYLGYFFESPAYKSYIAAKAMGVNINNLRRGDLEEITVPIAPLVQQTRIVAEIEKQFSRLDEAVANLERVNANLKRYKAAVVKAAVEGKLTEDWRKQHPDVEPADKLLERILEERRANWEGRGKYKEPVAPDTSGLPGLPEGWVWASVAQLGAIGDQAVLTGPFGSNIGRADFRETGTPVLTIGCLQEGGISLDKAVFVSEEKALELNRYRLQQGDMLFSRMASVGRAGSVTKKLEGSIFNYHLMRLRLSTQITLPEYIVDYVKGSKPVRDYVREVNHGATRDGINTEQLLRMPVALPSLEEQSQIVAEVASRLSIIDDAEAQIDADLRRADRLRQSILKQAFSGQLVLQDPNDESASVLLGRIRAMQPARSKDSVPRSRKKRTPAPKTGVPSPKPLSLVADASATYGDAIVARILAIMQPGREYARADLVEPLGLTTGQWNAAIQELKRRGQVRQMGMKRGARYLLT